MIHAASRYVLRWLPERGPGAVGWLVALYLLRLGLDAAGLYAFFHWGGDALLLGAAGGMVLVLFAALWREKVVLERRVGAG